MKFNNIILDGHNLFWRSWYENTSECLLNSEAIYNGGIQQFLDRLKSLQKTYGTNDTIYYILFDNPESVVKMRKQIDENYKSHRLNNKYNNEINRSISYLKEILRNYFNNSYIIFIDKMEADDLVPLVLEKCKGTSLLISSDLDWSRNISENVNWFNFRKIYNLESFKAEYDFYPNDNKILLYKAFKGDNSDNIPNAVPYLPKDILMYILDKYNSVPIQNLCAEILRDTTISKDWRYKIKNSENRIRKNYSLVDFIPVEEDINDHIQVCKRNKTLARVWCKIVDIEIPAWAIDMEDPVDFLSVKTFRKGKK